MLKVMLKLSGMAFLFSLLVACSGTSEKNIDYNTTKSMPGYGYVLFDFSKSKEIDYGRKFVPGKAYYIVNYVNDHDFLSVMVENADFNGRMLKAYVPYMKGYRLYDIFRLFTYLYKDCEHCDAKPVMDFVSVYIVDNISEARCEEATYKNNQGFEYMKGCNDMDWVERSQTFKGSVFITPHFYSGFQGMFTPYLKPGHSSAGS